MAKPELIYTIKRQPKTGRYSLRGRCDILLGVFETFAEAEREASERFPEKPTTFYRQG